jgi:Na+/H+ antiporter NhaD/arsenite permease-like protein
MLDPNTIAAGILMLAVLFTAFLAMAKYEVPQALTMAVVACVFLFIQGPEGDKILQGAFGHFSEIAILFTAVAIPAHMLDRSQGLQWLAAGMGRRLGVFTLRYPRLAVPMMVGGILLTTMVLASLLHNVTSILIMTPIIIRLCSKYEIPSRWILCGALVASNLGGFSTKWGDTPNIIESKMWNLQIMDFTREAQPANFIVLSILILVVLCLTLISMRAGGDAESSYRDTYTEPLKVARLACDYGSEQAYMRVDRRLLLSGLTVLSIFIAAQALFSQLQIALGALAIMAGVLLERNDDRLNTLKSLGYDVYLVFASIFIIAGCVEHSWIGAILQRLVSNTGTAPWAIALTGYLGTAFTEAASWATAASSQIQPLDNTHTAAWALGGGICAGSSSILTAASAGIILWEESCRSKDPKHMITFGRYLPFGISFSLIMLLFYGLFFTLVRY